MKIECYTCGGEGLVDSGGQNPDGSWINICCPTCVGFGEIDEDSIEMRIEDEVEMCIEDEVEMCIEDEVEMCIEDGIEAESE